ncbi:tRNA-uridine aminocarboxypropyltransferase [Thalassotalea aquiviva]|uniref:tRNA-uridine aminocarboxypropyltransferase n=1 Tax=Thalassotalea aquiviva TaxID=3242415 RepID=UPI00352A4EB1
MHAVHQLYLYRKSLSTREFKGRGWKVKRCDTCRVARDYCICDMVRQSPCNSAFLLLMYDNEVLKPSNTGRLIADVIPDTHACIWQRTDMEPTLKALLESEKYQPYLVFPKDYAGEHQTVIEQKPEPVDGKKPLFILIDSTWRQAKKILRKSPYLLDLPMLSIPSSVLANDSVAVDCDVQQQLKHQNFDSKYQVRKAPKEGQFATAEVAAKVLALCEEKTAAQHLDLWFEVFAYRYQEGVMQVNKGNPDAINNYLNFLKKNNL